MNKDKFCVYKKGGTSPISGGCYADRAKAVARVKALYANYKPTKGMAEVRDSVVLNMRHAFAELDSVDEKIVWIEALPAKTWHTLQYGDVAVTPEKLKNFAENFKKGVRGQEIATDYEHGLDPAKGTKASGWFRDFDVRKNDDGSQSLWAGIEFSDTAKEELKKKEWKYFSLEWDDHWKHPETGEVYLDVVCGGGLTNRPVAKGMVPINFSEVFNESEVNDDEEPKTLSEVLDEVADLEHSEPGSGNPPQPREQEGEEIDVKTGSRREPLPIETEDSVMTDEQLAALKELFSIEGDADADAVIAKAKEIAAERVAFSERVRELEKVAPKDANKKFAEQYPEEAKRMAELEATNRSNAAKAFSESVKRFTETKDEKEVTSNFGLSGLALQTVEDTHRKFSEGIGTIEDFEGAMKAVTHNGIVDYGERGSGLEPDVPTGADNSGTPGAIQSNRMKFAELVKEKQDKAKEEGEGKELAYEDAVRVVARENPELAAAYRQSASA